MMYVVINNVDNTMRGRVEITKKEDGDTVYSLYDIQVTAFGGGGLGIKAGRKSMVLDWAQAQALFALLHTANIDQGTDLLGEPAIYQLKKDTGVPF